jgi:hypothetical protein
LPTQEQKLLEYRVVVIAAGEGLDVEMVAVATPQIWAAQPGSDRASRACAKPLRFVSLDASTDSKIETARGSICQPSEQEATSCNFHVSPV